MKCLSGLEKMDKKVTIDKRLFLSNKFSTKLKVEKNNESIEVFVVLYNKSYYAYINKCKHLNVELDWDPNNFFDEEKRFIVCSTHGALYEPTTGKCVSGPCRGAYLESLVIIETETNIMIEV